MSQLLIQQYLNNLQDLRKVSGTSRESVVREAFRDLLKGWGRSLDLVFVPEYEITTAARDRRYVDGALLHALRVPTAARRTGPPPSSAARPSATRTPEAAPPPRT